MTSEKLWEQINKLCADIYDKADEATKEMVSSAFDLFEKESEANLEKLCLPFLRRVQARVDAGFELPPVNTVHRAELGYNSFYLVRNYDYPTFKWAIKSGFGQYIDCRGLYIPKKELSENAIEAIEKKIKT